MKIYTRTGDAGQTSIIGGTRMSKDAPRIEAYGTIDELNSHLGLLAANADTRAPERAVIIAAQSALFSLGSFLAGAKDAGVSDADVKALEESIDAMDRELPPLHNFILPGGCTLAAEAHIARTVCRRAERRIISATSDLAVPPVLLGYINRLSDWLYTFARYANVQAEVTESAWK